MQDLETKLSTLYKSGLRIVEISNKLGIPVWKCYELKQRLNLPTVDRWKKLGLSESFNQRTNEIVFGTLLGDGYLTRSGECKYRKLGISHGPKQQLYLMWLREQLSELKPSKIISSSDKWGTTRFYTPPHPKFDEYYQMCYPNGEKQVTKNWLGFLSPLSLAIWYMDDGSCQGPLCKLATCSFNIQSCEMLLEFLDKKWDIKAIIQHYKYPRLSFNKDNSEKLKCLIEEYLIPSMRYKLDFTYPKRKYDPVKNRLRYLASKRG